VPKTKLGNKAESNKPTAEAVQETAQGKEAEEEKQKAEVYARIREMKSKKRNWAFLMYPDSAPADWVEQLKKSGLKCAISPLHDRDLDTAGIEKKPHWHVIAVYNGPTTFANVKHFTNSLNATTPIALEQVRGYYRYLTHKDNPEKFQYSEKDIVLINGFDIMDFEQMSKSQEFLVIREIIDYIREKEVIEYSDLVESVVGVESAEWFPVVVENTLFFDRYLMSRRYRDAKEKSKPPKPARYLRDVTPK
jgi:hypothetical protein